MLHFQLRRSKDCLSRNMTTENIPVRKLKELNGNKTIEKANRLAEFIIVDT